MKRVEILVSIVAEEVSPFMAVILMMKISSGNMTDHFCSQWLTVVKILMVHNFS